MAFILEGCISIGGALCILEEVCPCVCLELFIQLKHCMLKGWYNRGALRSGLTSLATRCSYLFIFNVCVCVCSTYLTHSLFISMFQESPSSLYWSWHVTVTKQQPIIPAHISSSAWSLWEKQRHITRHTHSCTQVLDFFTNSWVKKSLKSFRKAEKVNEAIIVWESCGCYWREERFHNF